MNKYNINLYENFGRAFFAHLVKKRRRGKVKSSKLSGRWTEIGQNSGKMLITEGAIP